MEGTTPQNTAPSNDHYWNQLAIAANLAAKQDQIVWTVFGIFWAANAVLLIALLTDGKVPSRTVGIIVSAVGALTAAIWCLVQWRAIGFVAYYDALIMRLEQRLLAGDERLAVSGQLNGDLFREHVSGIRARPLVVASAVVVLIAWLGLLSTSSSLPGPANKRMQPEALPF